MAGEALSGAAQGAAVGTAIMPGWGTAIGAVAGAFMGGSSSTGGGASGGGAAATPMASQAAVFGSGIDGSGWQINFGSGSQTLDNRQDKTIRSEGPIASATPTATGGRSPYAGYYDEPMGGGLGLDSLGLGSLPPIVWLVLFGAVAWKLSKSKK
ncbi:MAG: hypothetical protein V4645_18190 [Pseudomonadota bacterium]